ncbi:hypothetical protein ACFQL9_11180, partial [Halobaculum lipolyticum]
MSVRVADRRTVVLVGGGYALVGVGLALVGFAGADWARAQFLADAGGAVARFGPTYLALAAQATATAGLVALVALAPVVGTLAGTGYVDPARAAAVVAAVALAVLFVAAAALAVGVPVDARGAGAEQVFSLGQA